MKEADGEERVDNITWRLVSCGGTCPLREPGVMPSRRGEGPGGSGWRGLERGDCLGCRGRAGGVVARMKRGKAS